MKKRAISNEFLQALKCGELKPILDAVLEDDTLCMELRGTAVSIYYRGGSLLRIDESSGGYSFVFYTKYCDSRSANLPANPTIAQAVELIPRYKQAMDRWLHINHKYEREFQQLILRENNCLAGVVSKSTDYYIADIEYAEDDSRFDMVAMKWLSKSADRKNPGKPTLALIEVKYGDGALTGTAGILEHLKDLDKFLKNEQGLDEFCKDMSQVFFQKCQLGLVEGLIEKQYAVEIRPEDVEVIFIFANHDPNSSILTTELSKAKAFNYNFPIKIANSSMMGYGLYADKFKDLAEL